MIYLAVPMGNANRIKFVLDGKAIGEGERLASQLEMVGLTIFLPPRDVDQRQSGAAILNAELGKIRECHALVAVLANTRGVYIEAGYAKALGKIVIGLRAADSRDLSKWGHAFFDFVAKDVDELASYLKSADILPQWPTPSRDDTRSL